MKLFENERYIGERALFMTDGAIIRNCAFEDGESPLKESGNLEIYDCVFSWKYPVWYSEKVKITGTLFNTGARSGIWYTDNITLENCISHAPKTFRRCNDVYISNCIFNAGEETLWSCSRVKIENSEFVGDYLGMNSSDVTISGLHLTGNYFLDGAKRVRVEDSTLISKDAFWNCEDVYCKNCLIDGEYLAWNSKRVVLENCKIISDQGLCYSEDLKLINCELVNAPLAFEFSSVYAELVGKIEGIKNPKAGKIIVPMADEVILDEKVIDTEKVEIFVGGERITSDKKW
jgi:hypothetical protein